MLHEVRLLDWQEEKICRGSERLSVQLERTQEQHRETQLTELRDLQWHSITHLFYKTSKVHIAIKVIILVKILNLKK